MVLTGHNLQRTFHNPPQKLSFHYIQGSVIIFADLTITVIITVTTIINVIVIFIIIYIVILYVTEVSSFKELYIWAINLKAT